MSPRTRRFRRRSSKVPRASSSPKRATRAIASVAGSSWSRSVCSAPARGCYSGRQNNAISWGRPPVTRIVPATRRRILQAAAASSVVALASADQAYTMFDGAVDDRHDKQCQDKYQLKVLFFYDYDFRDFRNSKRPIAEQKDLRGLKMRVQQAKVFADTINGLGGVAVPMAWGEVIPAAQQGVIDGADLPIVNILALKVYEVSKYCSMTYHNYGPTAAVMNLDIWNGLTGPQKKLMTDASRTAQQTVRQLTESVDNLAKAKELLEPKGMTINTADVEAFRRLAQDKVWPAYKAQFPEMWEEIVATKV